jgi:hypothetical protein
MNRKLIFAFFATAILLVMIREWSAPVACLRLEPTRPPRTQSR